MASTLLLLCAGILSVVAVAQAVSGRVVCYYGSWASYRSGNGKCDISDLDPNICTVLIYAFAGLDATTNSIISLDPYNDLEDDWGKGGFKKFNALRQINPSLITLIAIGGWNEGSAKYSTMASNSASRKLFVDSVISFIQTHGFNGLDFDWEYPSTRGGVAADKANFVQLIKELREEFDKYGYILSAAVGIALDTVEAAYDVPSLSSYLDFFNVMTYDYHGSWETTTGHNAPLYARPDESPNQQLLNMNTSIHNLINKGAEVSKMNLGMGAYGTSYTLADPDSHDLYASATPGLPGPYTQQAGILGYNEICEKFKNEIWTVVRELYYQAPYAYSGNQWVGYDDPQSLWVKSNWARNLGLGGGMVWSIETDDFQGICGEAYPLITAIGDVFKNGNSAPPASTTAATTAATAAPTAAPTPAETPAPTPAETAAPTPAETAAPTPAETAAPTPAETAAPTPAETAAPTAAPTPAETAAPTPAETAAPTPAETAAPTPAETPAPTSAPSEGKQFECTSSGNFADPNNCRIFYQCVSNGSGYTKYQFLCQDGLAFDTSINACNWKNQVSGCENS